MNNYFARASRPAVSLSSASSCAVFEASIFVTSARYPARYFTQSIATLKNSRAMASSTSPSPPGQTYDDALDALNSLQTPHHILTLRRSLGTKPGPQHFTNTLTQLSRIGYTPSDLSKLNIIHVAGTKGKGSVCAYVSSILSRYQNSGTLKLGGGEGLKTGLFTSPHLVSVRERIRINGLPISQELFAHHFFTVWNRLGLSTTWPPLEDVTAISERPPYFRFLTLLSFHIFMEEGVNAAVYEVGVGGEYDSTNIISSPIATGISKLGIDHVDTLGHTLPEIAWHKAGILKSGAAAFSVPQDPDAWGVVESRAKEKGVVLKEVGIDSRLEKQKVKISPDAKFQKANASLAIALTSSLLRHLDPTIPLPLDDTDADTEVPLPQEFVDGLEKVVWRGRCETVPDKETSGVTWFIDGAHTEDSLKVAASWFVDATSTTSPITTPPTTTSDADAENGKEDKDKKTKRVLIFNQQGRDTANDLLAVLYASLHKTPWFGFDKVIFTTNTTYKSGWKKDMENKMQDQKVVSELTVQRAFAETWGKLESERDDGEKSNVVVLGSIEEAILHVRSLRGGEEVQVHALVTGSLHLVGGFLGVLEGEI